jgi:glycosyl transferase family 87
VKQRLGRPLAVLLVLLAAWEVGRSLFRIDGVVFHDYLRVGDVVLAGGDPYALNVDTWPPFFQLVAAVLALGGRLSRVGELLLWQLGSVAAVWGVCRLLPRLGGEEPEAWTTATTLVPLAMSARLVLEHLESTQINLYLMFLVLLAFHLFQRRRAAWGGVALATAISARAVPILFFAYLLYKRAWRGAVWTTAFLVVLNVVLPLIAFGPRVALERWQEWRTVATAETQNPTPMFPNQSLLAALRRLLTQEGGARDPVRYAIAAWPPRRVQWLFYGLAAAGVGLLAAALRRNPPGLDDPSMRDELVIGLCVMALLTPLAWKAHFVTVLAGYWLTWRAVSGQNVPRWIRGLWWASFALLTLTAPALISTHARSIAESLNAITVGALLVLGMTIWAARRPRRQPRASTAGTTPP